MRMDDYEIEPTEPLYLGGDPKQRPLKGISITHRPSSTEIVIRDSSSDRLNSFSIGIKAGKKARLSTMSVHEEGGKSQATIFEDDTNKSVSISVIFK